MLVIDATPLCRVHDIARAVAITVGGASQAVDRLESAGLCARRANPSDRRSSIVELTPQGKELLRTAAPVFDRELDRLLRDPLPGTALTHLADALSTLRRSAATQAGGPAAGGPRGVPRRPAPPPAPSGRTDTAPSATASVLLLRDARAARRPPSPDHHGPRPRQPDPHRPGQPRRRGKEKLARAGSHCPHPDASPSSPGFSPAASTTGSSPSTPRTSLTCTPPSATSSATTKPCSMGSPCRGVHAWSRATSTGLRCSSARPTGAPPFPAPQARAPG